MAVGVVLLGVKPLGCSRNQKGFGFLLWLQRAPSSNPYRVGPVPVPEEQIWGCRLQSCFGFGRNDQVHPPPWGGQETRSLLEISTSLEVPPLVGRPSLHWRSPHIGDPFLMADSLLIGAPPTSMPTSHLCALTGRLPAVLPVTHGSSPVSSSSWAGSRHTLAPWLLPCIHSSRSRCSGRAGSRSDCSYILAMKTML